MLSVAYEHRVYAPRWESMLVHALVAAIGANPEPAVLAILNGLDKELAHLVGGCPLVTLLGQDNRSKLLFIPVCRSLGLLIFLFFFSGVAVQVLLLRLALDSKVVCKLALPSLLTVAFLVKDTYNRLGVDAKGHLLNLSGLVQQRLCLPAGLLGGLLLALSRFLLSLLTLLLSAATVLEVRRHTGDFLLGSTALFILHTKSPVLDRLGRLLGGGLLALLGSHDGQSVAG